MLFLKTCDRESDHAVPAFVLFCLKRQFLEKLVEICKAAAFAIWLNIVNHSGLLVCCANLNGWPCGCQQTKENFCLFLSYRLAKPLP